MLLTTDAFSPFEVVLPDILSLSNTCISGIQLCTCTMCIHVVYSILLLDVVCIDLFAVAK